MPQPNPDWKRPPVIEVVIGVQFAPLRNFHNGHLGMFWDRIRAEYPKADDAPIMEPVVENFGDEPAFAVDGMRIAPVRGDARLRMASDDGSHMIQAQNGWLIANWIMTGDGAYPGYTGVLAQFERAWSPFCDFVSDAGLGAVLPNLWELTYIDHMPRGTVWNEFDDIAAAVPGLLGCGERPARLEGLNASWGFRFPDDVGHEGRLRMTLQTGRSVTDPPRDLLIMRSTARGPITSREESVKDLVNAGHRIAVDVFMAVTSAEAQAFWEG